MSPVRTLPHMGVTSLDKNGYWFGNFSEQKDLSTAEYGVTATSFDFVYRHLSHCRLALRYFREAGMGYQDLYVAAPSPDAGKRLSDAVPTVG